MTATVTLTDYQTLLEHPNGMNAEVTESFTVKHKDIEYRFDKLDCDLTVVTRTLRGKEPERFVCYAIGNDASSNSPFVQDGNFVESISSEEGGVYNHLHIFVGCEFEEDDSVEAHIVTYKTDALVENNYVFVVETYGESGSWIEAYCGYLVNSRDVEYYE